MSLKEISKVTGRAVHVPGDDIDTDRIIPARFMKCVTFDGLGEYMFYDVRKDADGNDRKHPLNDPSYEGASILISGNNFGCGSSREHAPQAIYRAGFRGVIAEGFAEIFFGNSTQLGMPCVTAEGKDIEKLVAAIEADPSTEVTIDLEAKKIRFGIAAIDCEIREGARSVLLNGHWDPLQDLLASEEQVEAVAGSLAYMAEK
ncbi:MAG: 3-isopropylmalate dehydratase small subunit [Opitutales bacterium]|nr:3-isopropylmalate dehydratase small subunit [Opitutales bacterium]